jgi:hypothetical protein
LQCYDLHQSDHTIKEIADRVYGSARGALHTVSKAIARVKAAIEVAESGSWPPTDIK